MRRAVMPALVLSLSLGGCAGGSTSGGDDEKTLTFGQTFRYPDGLAVTVGKPQAFSPSSDAFVNNGEEAEDGPVDSPAYRRFTITITNRTGETFEPSFVTAEMISGDQDSDEIYDLEADVYGPPRNDLANGQKVSFDIGFGVEDPKDMELEVSPDLLDHTEFTVGS